MLRTAFACLLLVVPLATRAQPARMPIDGSTDLYMKPLFTKAAREGQAHGVFTGQAAEFMRQRFNTDAPLLVDVRTVRALPQAGCKRLEVTTRQDRVYEPNKQAENKQFVYEISYCAHGDFPMEPPQ